MTKTRSKYTEYSGIQLFALTFLRVLIGWHFLYEGMVKLFSPGGWTAEFFLANSVGPLSPLFKLLANNETSLFLVDQLNIWGLTIIGLGLFLGFYTRILKLMGMVLLFLYYAAYPPFAIFDVAVPLEGSYWIVNKNLVELAALFVLYLFPSSHLTGIDRYRRIRNEKQRIEP